MPAALQTQLQLPYRRDTWRTILGGQAAVRGLFKQVEFFAQPHDVPLTTERERGAAIARQQIGVATVTDQNGAPKKIAIYEVEVASIVDLPRNRVALRELVARSIDEVSANAVLAFFIQPGRDEYRLTYAARESELDIETLEVTTRETAPKRFTFLLGPLEPCRTAAQRLGELLEKPDVTLRDVERAFSVERLNKEFFKKYKEHYELFVTELINSDASEKIFGVTVSRNDAKEFDRACKPLRDFVKRLLGRIVFLHFLQRKGWLGCAANSKEWKNGDRDFMLNYFKLAEQRGEAAQFHSKGLTPLFFDALNNPERPREIFSPTNTRIPYLNGGLFEEAVGEARAIDFPEDFFRNLLEFFAQYNFTIDENDPEENEVGIDPEMLGHIFENLLEDNKDKGAYYTPKAIVQYMCQQALLQYLRTHIGEHPELDRLVLEKDAGDRNARSWVREHAKQIEQLIDNVKICDPAVGSGAFPIGMLNEMLQIKLALDFTLDPHEAKKALVENCLHGVDIDPGAIEIARLRFWLSLVVDAKTPEPLPNLDYKLYCADSLIERVRGEAVNVGTTTPNDPQLRTEIERLVRAKHKLYIAHSKPEKREAGHELYAALGSLAQIELTHLRNQANFSDAEFGRVLAAIEELGRLVRELEATKKAKVADRECALDAIQRWFEDAEKPTFLWQLHFGEVFGDGGFHIVIENPPYVRQESIKDLKSLLKKVFSVYTGMADLFVYFYERSIELLRQRGTLSIITSNKYYRSAYGKKLRGYLGKNLTLHTLIDFGDASVFDAIAYASILVGTKCDPALDHRARLYTWRRDDQLPLIIQIVERRGFDLPQSKLTPDGWRLEQPEVHALLEKLRSNGTPLGKYVDGRFYYGIKTGLNEAFVIDEATKNQLISEDAKSAYIIKPFLRGKDVKRWGADHRGHYLIKIESSENKKHPWSGKNAVDAENIFANTWPAIHGWFQEFRDKLIKRYDQGHYYWELRSCAYYDDFEKGKVLYPDIYKRQSFSADFAGLYSVNTTYFIPIGDDARSLASVLNARAVEWFYSQTSNRVQGGYLRAFTDYMRLIPIPNATVSDKARLSELADSCQDAVKSGDGVRLQLLEAEIDQIVYRLFDLTSEEIALIQNSTSRTTEVEVLS